MRRGCSFLELTETRNPLSLIWVAILFLLLPLGVGCLRDEEDSKEQSDKAAFEFDRLQAMPDLAITPVAVDTSGANPTVESSENVADLLNSAKPGHWIAARQKMLARENNFQGTMQSLVLSAGQPARTETSNHYLVVERPMVLQAGAEKDVELIFYIPRRLDLESRSVLLQHTLLDRLGRTVAQNTGSVSLMEPHQFFTVVLSNGPNDFSFLPTMPTHETHLGLDKVALDNVVLADCRKQVPLPSDVFGWTAISTILWHDLEPDRLDPGQQQAMIDWLHFGGQLIVSGPDSLESLRGSFLGEYLAARASGTVELIQSDLDEINQHWSLEFARDSAPFAWRIADEANVLGLGLEPIAPGRFVPGTGRLIADRAVGRGRVVVTAFSMTERSWKLWPAADNVLHNVLYLRPRRVFEPVSGEPEAPREMQFVDFHYFERQPLIYSKLRFFSRDWRAPHSQLQVQTLSETTPLTEDQANSIEGLADRQPRDNRANWETWTIGPYTDTIKSGVAGWNDLGTTSRVAKEILRGASGLEPPSRSFVLIAIGTYLMILVPLNWLVFRLLSRVEWAWAAAPIIAIIAGIAVVRAARLDIGFARSQSELVIVELPADYERAHVTRYSSLYTSLSTRFEVEFDSSVARGQPWGSRVSEETQGDERGVFLNRAGNLRLENFSIASNTTGLLHTEEWMDVGGALKWSMAPPEKTDGTISGRGSLINQSQLTLGHCAVVHCDRQGAWWGVNINELAPGAMVSIQLSRLESEDQWLALWQGNSATDFVGSDLVAQLEQANRELDDRLTEKELRQASAFEPIWLDAFRELVDQNSNRASAEVASVPIEQLSELAQKIIRRRFSVAGLIEVWARTARQSQRGTFLIGELRQLAETCHVDPLPSQREQQGMVIADLEPLRLPAPDSDLNLPKIRQAAGVSTEDMD